MKTHPSFTIIPTGSWAAINFNNGGTISWTITSDLPGQWTLSNLADGQAYVFKEGGSNTLTKISAQEVQLTITGGNMTYSSTPILIEGMITVLFKSQSGKIFSAANPIIMQNRTANCDSYQVTENWI